MSIVNKYPIKLDILDKYKLDIRGKILMRKNFKGIIKSVAIFSISTLFLSTAIVYSVNAKSSTKLYSEDTAKDLLSEKDLSYRTKAMIVYDYTESVDNFIVPISGVYNFECYGARGHIDGSTSFSSEADGSRGALGGYSMGSLSLTALGDTYYICVGGGGTCSNHWAGIEGASSELKRDGAGYNGGGNGGGSTGNGGGGATHIATKNRGLLTKYKSHVDELLLVAGGGGGAADSSDGGLGGGGTGSSANGTKGGNANYNSSVTGTGGSGATSSSGYAFGQGEDAGGDDDDAEKKGIQSGGGGGGYYGGYGGASNSYEKRNDGYECSPGASGGGGSAYVDTSVLNKSVSGTYGTRGTHAGHGLAVISLVSFTTTFHYQDDATSNKNITEYVTIWDNDEDDWNKKYYSLATKSTRLGYKFKGWNTKADGSGDYITSSIEVTADTIYEDLYAIWEPVKYSIKYNKGQA